MNSNPFALTYVIEIIKNNRTEELFATVADGSLRTCYQARSTPSTSGFIWYDGLDSIEPPDYALEVEAVFRTYLDQNS